MVPGTGFNSGIVSSGLASVAIAAGGQHSGGITFVIQGGPKLNGGTYPVATYATLPNNTVVDTLTIDMVVSLRDSGGTALLTVTCHAVIDDVWITNLAGIGGMIYTLTSSSITATTPGGPPATEVGAGKLSAGVVVNPGGGGSAVNTWAIGDSGGPPQAYAARGVTFGTAGYFVFVPAGATVTVDSFSLTDSGGWLTTGSHGVSGGSAARPVAAFTSTISDLTATFNASGSAMQATDADALPLSYSWTFDDGNTGTGVSPTESYPDEGTYHPSVVVTDQYGGYDSISHSLVIAILLGIMDSVHDQAGNLFGAASGQLYQFPAGVASRISRALVSSGGSPSLARMEDGRIFILTHNSSNGDAVVRVSHDNARTFA